MQNNRERSTGATPMPQLPCLPRLLDAGRPIRGSAPVSVAMRRWSVVPVISNLEGSLGCSLGYVRADCVGLSGDCACRGPVWPCWALPRLGSGADTPDSRANREGANRDGGDHDVGRSADHGHRGRGVVGDVDAGAARTDRHTTRAAPTGMVAITVFVAGLITDTVFEALLVT